MLQVQRTIASMSTLPDLEGTTNKNRTATSWEKTRVKRKNSSLIAPLRSRIRERTGVRTTHFSASLLTHSGHYLWTCNYNLSIYSSMAGIAVYLWASYLWELQKWSTSRWQRRQLLVYKHIWEWKKIRASCLWPCGSAQQFGVFGLITLQRACTTEGMPCVWQKHLLTYIRGDQQKFQEKLFDKQANPLWRGISSTGTWTTKVMSLISWRYVARHPDD